MRQKEQRKSSSSFLSITIFDWFVLTSFYLFPLALCLSFFLDFGQLFIFSSQPTFSDLWCGEQMCTKSILFAWRIFFPHVDIESYTIIGSILLYWCSILGLVWRFFKPFFFFLVVDFFWPYLLFGCAVFPFTFPRLLSYFCSVYWLPLASFLYLSWISSVKGERYIFSISVQFSRFSRRSVFVFVVVIMGTPCFLLYLDRMLDELQRSISPQRKTAPPKVETAEAKDSPVYVASVHHKSSSKSVSTSGTANQQLAEQAVTQTSIARRLFDTSADSKQTSSSSARVTRSKSPEPAHPIESYNVSVLFAQFKSICITWKFTWK